MRFQQYINEEQDYASVLAFFQMFDTNEMSDEVLTKLQTLGQKVGIKVRKSKTFHEQLKRAGAGVLKLMKLILDYAIHGNYLDDKALTKLVQDIKAQFGKVKKEDVISFIVNIDKTFLGLTSIPRHVLQNLLGVSITSYDNFQSNQDYAVKNLQKIHAALVAMNDMEDAALIKRVIHNLGGVVA